MKCFGAVSRRGKGADGICSGQIARPFAPGSILPSMWMQIWSAGCLAVALFCGFTVRADEPADQLERARVLREFQETPTPAASKAPSLPAARLEMYSSPATESLRVLQFQDSQWRKLLGDQQMQLHQPSAGIASESQWRAQSFDRERQAEDLSADILRRDLEYRSGNRR